jgi:hypothetical protein
MRLEKPRHFFGDLPMGIAPHDFPVKRALTARLTRRNAVRGECRGSKKALLRATLPRQGVLDPSIRDALVFDGMDECFEYLHLRVDVARAILD